MKFRSIAVIILIILLGVFIYFGLKNNNDGLDILTKNSMDDINTDLLQVQAKVKVLKEQSVVKDDEALLKGEKVKDSENEDIISTVDQLKDMNVISEDEENYDKYYVWEKDLLDELNLDVNLQDNEKIVINYETLEIILPNGIKAEKNGDKTYKFSEIKNVSRD